MAVEWQDLEKENARRRAYREAHEGRGPGSVIDARAPNVEASMSPLSWANTFKDSRTGLTRSPSAAATLAATDPSAFNPQQARQVAGLLGRPAAAPSIAASVFNEILPLNPFANTFGTSLSLADGQGAPGLQFGAPPAARPAPPSLSVLATGGENHAQRWMGNADRGMSRVAKYSDPSTPMRTTYGTRDEDGNPFRWASAFR